MKHLKKNLLTAMKSQMSRFSQVKTSGRIKPGSAGGRLPAVESFEVVLSEYNALFKQIGIYLRLPNEFKSTKTPMDKCNRYMKHQLLRIMKYKYTNPKLAGHIAVFCIKYSVSFRLSAINHVIPDGYFAHSTEEIGKICRKVDKLIAFSSSDVVFKRVYIPKPNGKVRPLGVPTVEGRIVLHMGNCMLIEIMRMEIGKSQHAFIPGRGTKTALSEVISKMNKYKYIYETDLKNFFNEISVPEIMKVIEKYSPPKGIFYHIENFCKNTPILTENDQVDERTFRDKEDIYNNPDFTNNETVRKILEPFKDSPELLIQYMQEDGCESLAEGLSLQGSLFSEHGLTEFGDFTKGVPQGMPLSPFLSILPLKEKYLDQCIHVNYADDQLFFSNEEIHIKDNKEIGIIHAEEKCGYVKYNGKLTEKGIKFLGMRIGENEIMSETRNGVKERILSKFKDTFEPEVLEEVLKITDSKEYSEILNNFHRQSSNPKSGLENVAKRNIFGFMLNALQTADWSNDKAGINARKAFRNLLKKINKNSLLGTMPKKTTSSTGLFLLHFIVARTMSKRYKNTRHYNKMC